MIHVVVIIMIHVVVIIMIHVVVVIMIHVVVIIMVIMHVVVVVMVVMHVVLVFFLTTKGIQERLIFRRRPVELEPGFDQVLGIDRIGVIEPDAPGIGPPVLIPG